MRVMQRLVWSAIFIWMLFGSHSQAQQQAGRTGCIPAYNGSNFFSYCSPPMGEILTVGGQVVCGRGHCASYYSGQVVCSKQAGGFAVVVDSIGQIGCTGGCEPPRFEYCEKPHP
jgi:hypothetical protein